LLAYLDAAGAGGSTAPGTPASDTARTNGIYSMAWGADAYGHLSREEEMTKRSIQHAASAFSASITREKAAIEAKCAELDIPVPGTVQSSKRKLSALQLQNQQSVGLPWWKKHEEKEREGKLGWDELAKLYFAQQIIASANSSGNQGEQASKRSRAGDGTSLASDTASNYASGGGADPPAAAAATGISKPVLQMQNVVANLRGKCPLVGPLLTSRSQSIIQARDVVDCISDAVAANAGNQAGWYGDRLGRSIQKERMLPAGVTSNVARDSV